jgi:hypothetical protein
VNSLLFLGVLVTSSLWAADEVADRATIEVTVSALNTAPSSNIFTADFPNAAELKALRDQAGPALPHVPATEGVAIRSSAGTVVISREPMGEAAWYPPLATTAFAPRFVTRSVTFTTPDTAVVIAVYERPFTSQRIPVLLVLGREGSDWRIASLRVISEAQTKIR